MFRQKTLSLHMGNGVFGFCEVRENRECSGQKIQTKDLFQAVLQVC